MLVKEENRLMLKTKEELELEIDELKEELKEKNNYISQLHLNILEIEKLKDEEIKILKNQLN